MPTINELLLSVLGISIDKLYWDNSENCDPAWVLNDSLAGEGFLIVDESQQLAKEEAVIAFENKFYDTLWDLYFSNYIDYEEVA